MCCFGFFGAGTGNQDVTTGKRMLEEQNIRCRTFQEVVILFFCITYNKL